MARQMTYHNADGLFRPLCNTCRTNSVNCLRGNFRIKILSCARENTKHALIQGLLTWGSPVKTPDGYPTYQYSLPTARVSATRVELYRMRISHLQVHQSTKLAVPESHTWHNSNTTGYKEILHPDTFVTCLGKCDTISVTDGQMGRQTDQWIDS